MAIPFTWWTGVAPVMQVDLPQRRIYQLGEKLYFCPEGCCVQEEGGEAVSFSPLECHAMLMFIAAERHELSSMDLVDGLWQGKANVSSVHTLINRLRKSLKVFPSIRLVNENRVYKLLLFEAAVEQVS